MKIYYSYVEKGGWATTNGETKLDSDEWSLRGVKEFLQDKHPTATIKAFTVEVS